jgi:hypothetical protein
MTKQIPDTLIYKGQEHTLDYELLSGYMYENKIEPPPTGVMTALWRGYIAEFEIRDGQLFLNDLHVMNDEEREPFIQQAFPGGLPQKLGFISQLIVLYSGWVDGSLRLPAQLNTWQRYEVLEIKNGNLTGSKTFTHEEMKLFEEEQYEYFLLTDEYAAKKQAAIDRKTEEARKNHTGPSKRPRFVFDEALFNEGIKENILWETKHFY